MRCLQATILAFFLVGNADDKTTRRGFFAKLKESYLEGRYSREEKRVLDRKQAEKLRRRVVYERNVNRLVDGISSRLKRGPRQLTIFIVGGTTLILWLCHKGAVGCNKQESE